MVVRVGVAGSTIACALHALVLIMLSSATIRGAVAAVGLLLGSIVILHRSLNMSMSMSMRVAVAVGVMAVTVVAGSRCGCRCGRGSRGLDGLRSLVNADDTAGLGSCEVEDRFGRCRWHGFAAHHLRAHHTGVLHTVVVVRAMGTVGWVSTVAAETVEVTEAASTAGAARTATTTSTERTVSARADLSHGVITSWLSYLESLLNG